MSTIHGTHWWSELRTRDIAASRAWYEAACGWTFETSAMEGGEYHLAMAHGRPVAGMMDISGYAEFDGVPPHWFTYFAVDDLDAALAEATDKGGRIVSEPFDVPNTGRIAIVEDAGGATVGLMKPVPNWDAAQSDGSALDNVPV